MQRTIEIFPNDEEGFVANRNTLCGYLEGMFAHEPQHEYACLFANLVTCHHEAGHAVAAHVLGLGIGRGGISIRETHNPKQGTFSSFGICYTSKAAWRKTNALLRRGAFGPILVKQAIVSAAGPAAERKHCRETGAPVRTLFASEGDHEDISKIGKNVLDRSRYFRHALERFAWRKAQEMLEHPAIWSAVCDLADRLNEITPDEENTEHQYSSFEIMPGSEVRRYLRDSFRAA